MFYVITGKDSPGSLEIRKRVRDAHLARARQLVSEGRMLLAGPCPTVETTDLGSVPGISGSVIIAEFPSLQAAQDWIAQDPYVTEGVFESHEVRPFVKVLP